MVCLRSVRSAREGRNANRLPRGYPSDAGGRVVSDGFTRLPGGKAAAVRPAAFRTCDQRVVDQPERDRIITRRNGFRARRTGRPDRRGYPRTEVSDRASEVCEGIARCPVAPLSPASRRVCGHEKKFEGTESARHTSNTANGLVDVRDEKGCANGSLFRARVMAARYRPEGSPTPHNPRGRSMRVLHITPQAETRTRPEKRIRQSKPLPGHRPPPTHPGRHPYQIRTQRIRGRLASERSRQCAEGASIDRSDARLKGPRIPPRRSRGR